MRVNDKRNDGDSGRTSVNGTLAGAWKDGQGQGQQKDQGEKPIPETDYRKTNDQPNKEVP